MVDTTVASSEEDRYEVLEKIGHGSFGIIRKVRRKEDGQILCRKEINYLRMSNKEKEQLQAEVAILRDLIHPNIVRYYDKEHLKASQDLHLYMEYCGNGDLGKVIKDLKQKNQYAEEEFVWSTFSQLASALYRCHHGEDPPDAGRNVFGLGNNAKPSKAKRAHLMVLHRDLKPENVFLDSDNSVKLGDFGLSKILAAHDFAFTYVGTPYYMSPEVCGGEQYTHHSDVWSLGCIMWELCARDVPFNAKTHIELCQKIRLGEVDRIPSCYSQELQRVINACLRVNPNNRPDTTQLLNLPMMKLMRKEQEVVYLSRQVKEEKARATRSVEGLNDKIERIEKENAQFRRELDETLRKEWETKAQHEINRLVQLESQRLEGIFEEEVQKRVNTLLAERLAEQNQDVTRKPTRSLTPTLPLEDEQALSFNGAAQSQGTLGSPSDFPSQTDLSSLSIDSPIQSKPSFKLQPQKRPARTPFTRAKTFQQGTVAPSPGDVHMADPSPMSVGALSLSPRRLGRGRNLFAAAEKWQPTLPPSLADVPSDSEVEDNMDGPDDDDLPTLPSPTRPRSALAPRNVADPFNAATKPILKPSQPRAPSAPSLSSASNLKTLARVRPHSAVPTIATSPARRRSKMPTLSETGSPARKVFSVPGGNVTAPTAASTLKSKKSALDDLRRPPTQKNVQGRTLVELAQGRAANNVSPDGMPDDRESSSPKKGYGSGRMNVAEWDPERDEDMPSPFLIRGNRNIR